MDAKEFTLRSGTYILSWLVCSTFSRRHHWTTGNCVRNKNTVKSLLFEPSPFRAFRNFYCDVSSSLSTQGEPNPALWLATRAGKITLFCSLGITRCVPQEKSIFSHIINLLLTNVRSRWPPLSFSYAWSITHMYLSQWPHERSLFSAILKLVLVE